MNRNGANHYVDSDEESDEESDRQSAVSEAAKRPLRRRNRTCGAAHRTCVSAHTSCITGPEAKDLASRFKKNRLSLLIILILSFTTLVQTFRLSGINMDEDEPGQPLYLDGNLRGSNNITVLDNATDAMSLATNGIEEEQLLFSTKAAVLDDPNNTNHADLNGGGGDETTDAVNGKLNMLMPSSTTATSTMNTDSDAGMAAALVRDSLTSMVAGSYNAMTGKLNDANPNMIASTSRESDPDMTALLRESIYNSMATSNGANNIENDYGGGNQRMGAIQSGGEDASSIPYVNGLASGVDGSNNVGDTSMINGDNQVIPGGQQEQQFEGTDQQQLDVLMALLQKMTPQETTNLAPGTNQ